MQASVKDNVYITQNGFQQLKEKLSSYEKKRQQLANQLKNTISRGDDMDFANRLNEQEALDQQISELRQALNRANVVEDSNGSRKVVIGSKVQVEKDGDISTYTIAGALEADPTNGYISNESPLGEALLGKIVGNEVEVYLSSSQQTLTYKIAAIS